MKWQLSTAQTDLLRAALCRGETARSALHKWCERTDFEALDLASYRLLPLLARNLHANGIESALLPRLQGIYRRTWVENQLLFDAVAVLTEIDVTWLGEAALAKNLYGDWGVRPLGQVTVGGSAATCRKLRELVKAAGWRRQLSLRQLWHGMTRQQSLYRFGDRYSLRVAPFNGTADAAAQLDFILRDPGSARPNNRLVFLADIFHLMQQLPADRAPDHPLARYVNQLVGTAYAEV
jgi:hypothetical protein